MQVEKQQKSNLFAVDDPLKTLKYVLPSGIKL